VATRGRIVVDRERCKGCRLCIVFCPQGRLSQSDQLNEKGYFPVEVPEEDGETTCTGCTTCGLVCPEVAIEIYREQRPKKGETP